MQRDDRRSTARWTRREFVRGAAGVVALPHLPQTAGLLRHSLLMWPLGKARSMSSACAATAGTSTQRVPSPAPASILLSAAQRILYVANEVDVHEGLPRGTVEAFHIDPFNGHLTLFGPQTTVSFRNASTAHGSLTRRKVARSGRLRRRYLQPVSRCEGRPPGPGERHL